MAAAAALSLASKVTPTLEHLLTAPFIRTPQGISERIRELVNYYPSSPMAQLLVDTFHNDQAYQQARHSLQNSFVKVGDDFPTGTLGCLNSDMAACAVNISDLLSDLNVFVFVPGSGTKVCSKEHIPEILLSGVAEKVRRLIIIGPNSPDNMLLWQNQMAANYGALPANVFFYGAKSSDIGDRLGILRPTPEARLLSLTFHRTVVITQGEKVAAVMTETDSKETGKTNSAAITKALNDIFESNKKPKNN